MSTYKVSDYAKELVQGLSRAAMGYMFLSNTIDFERAEAEVLDYILTREMRIAELEAETPTSKWQTGFPKHDRQVLVCLEDDFGNRYYDINNWARNRWWQPFFGKAIIGWKEIEPFDLEGGG